MSKIEKLEDLLAWKKSKDLAVLVYKITENGKFTSDFGLCNQIRKSAISVPSNIAEGFGREGNKEFIQFLSVAKGSLYELKTQILIALEIKYITEHDYKVINDAVDEIAKIISGLISYLNRSDLKGAKFK